MFGQSGSSLSLMKTDVLFMEILIAFVDQSDSSRRFATAERMIIEKNSLPEEQQLVYIVSAIVILRAMFTATIATRKG